MFRGVIVALVVAGLALTGPAHAGKYNRKLKIGDAAPAFKELDGVDGKKHSFDEFKNKDVVVLVITCNHCPVARAYEKRIVEFTKKHGDKVAVVAISVNTGEEDQMPQMQERAKEVGFNFPYLHDPSQKIGRALGATHTPEFFVFDKDRKVVYMGAYDDDLRISKVKEKYLDDAVASVLKGEKPATAETPALGCGIPYK